MSSSPHQARTTLAAAPRRRHPMELERLGALVAVRQAVKTRCVTRTAPAMPMGPIGRLLATRRGATNDPLGENRQGHRSQGMR